ncbi:MAG: hypothetical protein ABI652_05380 [Acidobacteriota bacterium]
MRLLRGLSGKLLTCGCFLGIYETYDGQVVKTIDARGGACGDSTHELHAVVQDSAERTPSPRPARLLSQ